jgi:hypothetical protein
MRPIKERSNAYSTRVAPCSMEPLLLGDMMVRDSTWRLTTVNLVIFNYY